MNHVAISVKILAMSISDHIVQTYFINLQSAASTHSDTVGDGMHL